MKGMFQWLKGSRARSGTECMRHRLTLAAFGKHPGWDDHIPGIGVESDALAQVKQTLYVTGIGRQIDAGAWEKLEPEKRIAGFDHTLLWLRPGHVLLGRLWSSRDGKGRAKYPMVLCLDGEALPTGFMLSALLPGLKNLRDACKNALSAKQVIELCRIAQEELRGLLARAGNALPDSPPFQTKQRFLTRPELGPDRLGWMRVLHDLGTTSAVTAGGHAVEAGQGINMRSHALRVPLAEDSVETALHLWTNLLRVVIPEPVPLLLLAREGLPCLDIIVHEPEPDDFFCLQASPKALPLVTEIPYQLAPNAREHWGKVEAKFLGLRSTPPPLPSTAVPNNAPGLPAGSVSSRTHES